MATENKTLLTLALIPQYEGITIAQRAILYAMARYTNQTTGSFWPSMQTVAKDLHTDIRHIQRCVRDLEARGILRRVGEKHVAAGIITEWRVRDPGYIKRNTPGPETTPTPGPQTTGGVVQGCFTPRSIDHPNCLRTIDGTGHAPIEGQAVREKA